MSIGLLPSASIKVVGWKPALCFFLIDSTAGNFTINSYNLQPVMHMKPKTLFSLSLPFLAIFLVSSCCPADKAASEAVDLFDGQSLDGWQNFGGGNFYVEDGAIVGQAAMGLPNSFLATEKMYDNFELELEFLVDPLLNSGIQIRSNTYATETTTIRWGGRFKPDGNRDVIERVWPAGRFWGYQIEIDPTERAWSGAVYEEGGRGFLHTPGASEEGKKAFRQSEWNHFRIIADGDHFRTWLNGVPVADIRDDLTATGYIALQLHGIGKNAEKEGIKVRWRNIRLTELD